MQMKYIITKSSRKGSGRMYTGITWKNAGLDAPEEESYFEDYEQAKSFAQMLSQHNPVGFIVAELRN